jgi:hypothetical protein
MTVSLEDAGGRVKPGHGGLECVCRAVRGIIARSLGLR